MTGYVGDPFSFCRLYQPPLAVTEATVVEPCTPSPCGPNSLCRNVNDQAVCSCAPEYIGTPPNCRPECVVNAECSSAKACHRFKCTDPCPGSCGIGARCEVINHNPICSCPQGLTGDPFIRCYEIPRKILFSYSFEVDWQNFIFLRFVFLFFSTTSSSASNSSRSLCSFTVRSELGMSFHRKSAGLFLQIELCGITPQLQAGMCGQY